MKEGVFVYGDSFYLRILDRKDDKPSNFGFVVPNKVKKTSVGRHLIKRRLSDVVEKLLITLKPGLFCLIFCKKDVFLLPYSAISKGLSSLLSKAKILS